jgi:polysaccharide chain length determinant protein (PEP-CTERM system associated)
MALDIINRRKWIAIPCFLLAFAAVAPAVAVLPEIYSSTATVLIENQQIPDSLVRSTVTSALEIRLQTISQEILSRSNLEELIHQFGLFEERRKKLPLELIIPGFRKDIEIDMQRSRGARSLSTFAFTVSYRGRDPQKVADVTNALTSLFIEENMKIREEQASGTSQFLRNRLEEMQSSLEEMERRVARFKNRHIGELPHQQDGNIATLEQLNTRLQLNAENQTRISERLKELETLLEQAHAQAAAAAGDNSPDATAARLAELRQELNDLRKQYGEKYPDVLSVRREIEALEERLQESENTDPEERRLVPENATIVQLTREISDANVEFRALQSEEQSIQETIAAYQERVEAAPRLEQEYQVLMRDYETTSELYRSLLERQKEAELAESMEQRQKGEQFRVIEPAIASSRPAAPDRQKLLLLGFVLSLGFAAGIVAVLEYLDTSYHTLEALRSSVKVPVLCSVPPIVTESGRRLRHLRIAIALVSVVVGAALVAGASYFFAAGNERLAGMLML